MPERYNSRYPKPLPRGISCLSLVLHGIRIGGFHAGIGYIIGAGGCNMMIPPTIDSVRRKVFGVRTM